MRKFLYIIIPIILIIIVLNSLNSDPTDEAYTNEVADVRAERVRYLKSSQESPFVKYEIKYRPIEYFTIDPSFKVRANLERIENPQRILIPNTDGTQSTYTKFAYAKFTLENQPLKLLILKQAGFGALPNAYFTGFADETSGDLTYGGGRYLDLEISKSDNITIDFNLAYNPYCAYSEEYTCPLPPPENLLPVKINAGEKDYKY